jgi:hypothetical protein
MASAKFASATAQDHRHAMLEIGSAGQARHASPVPDTS